MNLDDQILVENVSFAYGRQNIIEKAHFHIEKGSFCSFIGPNGGGKTTMAKLVLGLLNPDTGYISVFGENTKTARKKIGYVPQHSVHDRQFPILVKDVVLMGRLGRPFGFYSKYDYSAAMHALELMDIQDLGNSSFASLSGGQQQRTLIARALAAEPEILLLDEPTANIDAASESKLYELLKGLQKIKTIIVISHNLAFVSEYVDKVICIDRNVHIHSTNELSKQGLEKYFGQAVRLVDHKTHIEEKHD